MALISVTHRAKKAAPTARLFLLHCDATQAFLLLRSNNIFPV
jgi:hypothetical protein